ncbi:MAG: hypothetical protein M0Q51_16580 [Bacteroidales bacterium]|nr:hypothetical protein [Bacteroidales bacterium]
MKDKNHTNFKILVILMAFFIVLFFGCSNNNESESVNNNNEIHKVNIEKAEGKEIAKDDEIAIESPPFTEGIFPCNDCHADMEPNPLRRELVDLHDDISSIFDHDSENRWCLDCHDMNNRNYLKLASGKLIGFDESYKLCGQCHGDKLRDWKVGVHGKRTGEWNGKKQYLLCVHCHNPHSPKFKPMKPLPPPVRQEDIN